MAQGQEFIKVGKVDRVPQITIDHPPMNTI